jgi:hypothetical protein
MCHTVARHLEPGGRFVGTLPDSCYDAARPLPARYGASVSWTPATSDGDSYTLTFHTREPFGVECYYWSRETYGTALRAAGLQDVVFHSLRPSAKSIAVLGNDYWDEWNANPSAAVVAATKPA